MEYAGIDTHKDDVLVHIINDDVKVVAEERLATTDTGFDRLAHLLKDAQCVMEAGSTCYPVYDALIERGIKPKVAHPLYLKSNSGLKKTDKVDARRMALMLKAGIIPEAHIPNVEVREARELVKQHVSIVQQRTMEICKAKALLLRHRIKYSSNLFGKKADWFESSDYPAGVRLLLSQACKSVQFLSEQKKQVDRIIEGRAKLNADAVILHSIPGVGWYGAYLLAVYIDCVERFGSCEQLVSYAGLAPTIHQSGKTMHMGRISKLGRPEIRGLLGQCAWVAVGNKNRFRKKYLKIKRKHGKKKAIVAVARKMLVTAYYLLKKREQYKEVA